MPSTKLKPNPATNLKPNKNMIDIREIEATSNPDAFKTSIDLKAIPKFNQHGDNIDPIIRSIPIHNIDEYAFNPRQADNDHFEAIKESIQKVGLQQRFSVVRNPETKRYTLIKGGNTRLLVFKELYRETGDIKFSVIDCIVEPWNGELNRTQAVIAHLIENEARGELILVDKAKALIELEREYKNNGIESLTSGQTKLEKSNISTTTQEFIHYLKNNGYSVSEKQLGLFRFTAIKLVGNLDRFLNQGLGSPQIIKIRAVYNNLKRIIKDAGIEDYSNESLDNDFFEGLKKYNKTRNPFDFDRLLDSVVFANVAHSPFVSLFKNNTEDFRKELLTLH
jgi:ParB family protein of integrating conjugative element (PFGI_1 class)